ncbi:MAG: cysteine-rich CWC family protein [Chitinophagaceae bacterium]|nr:cysteine-rich CWC family protein [Chitinophagaceae bacterium]MCC6634891.1 cysteine-rich CWC family protein [Chitinophagaceae bacterium]
MKEQLIKICFKCKSKFVCNSNNIKACNCTSIQLSNEESSYIKTKFSDCLCNNCLNILKQEYRQQ